MLAEKDFNRSLVQCCEKVKKLKKDYRKICDNNNATGRKQKSCKFFDELDKILAAKPVTKPTLVISSELGLSDHSDDKQFVGISPISDSLEIGENGSCVLKDDDVSASDNAAQTEHCSTSTPSPVGEPNTINKRKNVDENIVKQLALKRKKTATKLERSLETVTGKFMEGQREMEARYNELEEKQTAMELELEKRRMEMEEKNDLTKSIYGL